MNIAQLKKMKQAKQKITMVTCYDYCFAQLLKDTSIDCILVGDSAAMTMHGHDNTVPADMDMMVTHIRSVAKAQPAQLIVGDMPFLSYRIDLATTMRHALSFMQAGAQAIKIEGVDGHEEAIAYLVQSGVPVMGHLGLTPQAIHQLSGFKVQGREPSQAAHILAQARKLEELGCFAIVLECIPAALAQEITAQRGIPTIGIGAGSGTDGQVLVLHDLLGLQTQFKPKFLKQYLNGAQLVQQALNDFDREVKQGEFPTPEYEY
ncbi:MAG TPA: 3-methyl-2-oxobutanoate hydroxymethyltransferase [Gammaproteobacteria bacterium]|nr:3-methyl-2-oxobutanoate hydroxymethyltransferase [Gammaproteobacteria bacterium]